MNREMPLLIELHYLPTVQYFSKLLYCSKLILEQQENYTKRSYRNRAHIATANGRLRLSIPLEKGKNQQQPIRKVKISYEETWQSKHWMAIQSAYGNAPFFEFYADDIRPFYQEKIVYLFDFNLKLLKKLFSIMNIDCTIELSSSYLPNSPSIVYDLRNAIRPNRNRLNLDKHFKIIPYHQVFKEKTGFLSNLSILDLLFCCGPEAIGILKASVQSNI